MYPRIKILRKWLAIVLVLFLLLSSLPFSAFATDENEVVFYIDKKFYQKGDQIVETDVAPYIKNGRTMVPVAFVAPALGTDPAQWFPKDRMVLVNKDQDQIAIFIDSKELMVNSEKLQMDVAAEIKDIGGGGGRTMLPIAFIARALDVVYEWVETTRSVHFYGDLIYDQPGTIGPDTGVKTLKGNVIVKAPDVKLQNLIIKGNLIISKEVGEGGINLETIQVLGTTFIRGGGSITLSKETVLNEVIIDRKITFNNQGRIVQAVGALIDNSQFKGNLPENFPKPAQFYSSGGGVGGGPSSPSTVKVTGVSIVEGNQSVNIDSTLQLTASVTPANATNKGVTWHSSDGAIALISGDGLVSGLGPGTVTIWATTVDGGFKSEVLITVHEPSEFAGGEGTDVNPYQVATAEQLDKVRSHLDKNFIQIADIDLGVAPWNEGQGWQPIGNFSNRFTGSFNGNGYKITGLTINRDSTYQGLFGVLGSGTIEKAKLINANINGESMVGALVGYQAGGSIIKCSAEGTVLAENNVGGLVGQSDGVITGCYTNGVVQGTTITNQHYYYGGLAGRMSNGASLTNCYSTSTVIGDRVVGGLVGLVFGGKVEESFSTGQVSGNAISGGLIGEVGGEYQILDSYYDKETSGIEYDWKGEPKTTAQMKHRVNYIGWNFTDIWGFNPCENNGYPFLRWQGYEHISDFAGGDGRVANPYQVATAEQLDKVRDYLDYHFIQTTNIDLGVAPWNGGDGWVPIGSTNFHSLSGQEFNGSYDGNGYSITGLYINQEDEDYLGLFGATTSGSVLKNIKLENVSITGDEEFGALVGRNHGLIENCSAINVNIQGNDHLGGLVGLNRGTVDTCYTTGTVTGTGYPAGGLVGENNRHDNYGYLGIVSNSFSSVNVSGEEDIGGLIGSDSQGTVTSCFATGNVVAYDDYAGGLVGSAWHTTITDCYATGQVNAGGSSADDCGGLIGGAVSATVTDCYATGYVYGRSNIGGLIGDDGGSTISRSYATGNISGTIYATGGLIGYASGSTINQCFAISNVSGRDSVGGLVGLLWFSEIHNSYATGSVAGHSEVGGLAGHPNISNSTVNNCYSIGMVSGSSNVGGLIGYNITANNSYYNNDTSNQSDTGKGEPKITVEMVQLLTYETWNFSNIWAIENNSSYPYLQWQGNDNIIYPIMPKVDYIVFIMDMEVEDITERVDTTQLEADIVAAQNLHDGAEEGAEPGQYAIGSKAILQVAIVNAQTLVDAKTLATVEQVTEAEETLRSAVTAFSNALVEQDKEAVIPDEPVAEFDGEIVEIDEMVVELGEQVNME